MAEFAKLDENNIVKEIHVVADSVAITEEEGIEFLKQLLGSDTNWKQTFCDGTRKNPAGINYTYDESKDAFIQPKPHDSWVLNEDTCRWESATPMPEDGKEYSWNEDTTSWEEMK